MAAGATLPTTVHVLLRLLDTRLDEPAREKSAPLLDLGPWIRLVIEEDTEHLSTTTKNGARFATATDYDRHEPRAARPLALARSRLQMASFFGRDQQPTLPLPE